MKNLVITGTSGVGKTFLEEELEKRKLSFQLPKYTDRKARPGENSSKLICLSSHEFQENRVNFFFTLKYGDFNYGWKRKDLKNGVITLAITQDSLEGFMKKNPDFWPVLLEVEEKNFEMLVKRMERRGESLEKINKRLEMAKIEFKNRESYRNIVKKYQGLVFDIKDDKTIFEEVIPELAKRQ